MLQCLAVVATASTQALTSALALRSATLVVVYPSWSVCLQISTVKKNTCCVCYVVSIRNEFNDIYIYIHTSLFYMIYWYVTIWGTIYSISIHWCTSGLAAGMWSSNPDGPKVYISTFSRACQCYHTSLTRAEPGRGLTCAYTFDSLVPTGFWLTCTYKI